MRLAARSLVPRPSPGPSFPGAESRTWRLAGQAGFVDNCQQTDPRGYWGYIQALSASGASFWPARALDTEMSPMSPRGGSSAARRSVPAIGTRPQPNRARQAP